MDTNKINLISGAVAGPLVKSLWEMSDYNPDVPKRLYQILSRLSAYGLEHEVMELLRLLHDVLCMKYPESVSRLSGYLDARSYFLSELLLDIDEVAQELIAEY